MKIFGRKTKGSKEEAKKPVERAEAPAVSSSSIVRRQSPAVLKRAVDYVLISPRITEKATGGNAWGCYVFDIPKGAGKRDVRDAIVARYGLVPRHVGTAMVKSKNVLTRGSRKAGVKAGGKKAYVYLKAGDKIELA